MTKGTKKPKKVIKKAPVKKQELINGLTPLMIACRAGDLEAVKKLAGDSDLAFKNKNGHTALDIATIKGYTEVAKFLSTK